MSNDLYRQEALDSNNRSLYGDVKLTPPPKTWLITILLVVLIFLLGAILLFGEIGEGDSRRSILKWLLDS